MLGIEPLFDAVHGEGYGDPERELGFPVWSGWALVECFVVCLVGHRYFRFFMGFWEVWIHRGRQGFAPFRAGALGGSCSRQSVSGMRVAR